MNTKLNGNSICCALCAFADRGNALAVPGRDATPKGAVMCRRYPPAVKLLMTQQGVGVQSHSPLVAEDYWCGEFVPQGGGNDPYAVAGGK